MALQYPVSTAPFICILFSEFLPPRGLAHQGRCGKEGSLPVVSLKAKDQLR